MGLGSGIQDPRSGICVPEKPILDPGSRSKKAPDPGSQIPDPGSWILDPGSGFATLIVIQKDF
jgi:hypothetical protein